MQEPYPGYVDDLEHAIADLREVVKTDLDSAYWNGFDKTYTPSLADYVTDPRSQRAIITALSRSLEHA